MKFTSDVINRTNSWQIGTGDGTRDYFDVFLKYGVALVGPGNPGKEGEIDTAFFYSNSQRKNYGKKLIKVKKGEWLIARNGLSIIVGIGQIIEEYSYSNLFEDIDGWDLQHFVKVKWFKPLNQERRIILDSKQLSQYTISSGGQLVVFDKIYGTDFEEIHSDLSVEDTTLPRKLTIDDIIQATIDIGIRIQDAENIGTTLNRIIRLAAWYEKNDYSVLEAEIMNFLITPLLIALGWSEQKMKIEYHWIDIALFADPFKGNYKTTPQIIIEVKTFSEGLSSTDKQLLSYAGKFPDCKKFIATNGFRYKYFEKQDGELKLMGYFNLLKLVENNIHYNIKLTAIETLFTISNFIQ